MCMCVKYLNCIEGRPLTCARRLKGKWSCLVCVFCTVGWSAGRERGGVQVDNIPYTNTVCRRLSAQSTSKLVLVHPTTTHPRFTLN